MIEYTVLQGLALFGITWLIRHTDGPFDLFLKLRKLAGIAYLDVYDVNGTKVNIIEEIPEKFLAKMIGCFWCLGTWIAALLTLYAWHNQYVIQGFEIVVWLGSIGVAGLLYEMIENG